MARRRKQFFNPELFLKPTDEPIATLAIEAFSYLQEADYWIDKYNETARQLRQHEYNQFDTVREYSSGCSEIRTEWIFQILQDGPTPERFREYFHDDPSIQPPARQTRRSIQEIRSELGEQCSWICIYCQKRGELDKGPDGRQWHVDHIFAVSRGGDSKDDNLTLSCATCNQKKHAKLASEILMTIKARLAVANAS